MSEEQRRLLFGDKDSQYPSAILRKSATVFLFLAAQVLCVDIDGMYSKDDEVYKYQDPNMMLKYSGPVYLYRASFSWGPHRALCMRSNFIKQANGSYYRTLEYLAPRRKYTNAKGYVMRSFNLTLKLMPVANGHSQPVIRPEQEPNDQPSKGHSWEHLLPNGWVYPVLFANHKCLITGSYNHKGMSFCTMWVTSESIEHPLRYCNYILLASCGNPIYNAYYYDNHVRNICKFS
uniref:Uncharacterized protein n=1 Tax=Amblyomma maculatum TaxID=34609 RepID=G3MRW0_AMBMU